MTIKDTPQYKWASPQEWVVEACQNWNDHVLRSAFIELVMKQDADTIQDLYESDMDNDGYFEPLKKQNSYRLRCPKCGIPTIEDTNEDLAPDEALCNQCYDQEE
jgi:formylmethanofuran dehydrogenase subunit E